MVHLFCIICITNYNTNNTNRQAEIPSGTFTDFTSKPSGSERNTLFRPTVKLCGLFQKILHCALYDAIIWNKKG